MTFIDSKERGEDGWEDRKEVTRTQVDLLNKTKQALDSVLYVKYGETYVPLRGDEEGNLYVTMDDASITLSLEQLNLNTDTIEALIAAPTPAGENVIGKTLSDPERVTTAIANTAATYSGTTSVPVCVGTTFTLANIMRINEGKCEIGGITLRDGDNIKASLLLFIFKTAPSAGTYTNTSAPVFSTDFDNIIAVIPIYSNEYSMAGDKAVADFTPTPRILKSGVNSKDLYGLIVSTGTAVYTHANALSLDISVFRE
ncbi:MAG: hypothetical protein WA125_06290 [Desulfosporosinus sp.]